MSVNCDGGDEPRSFEDRITKKVRFKEGNGEEGVDMVGMNEEFVLLEGDMVKSIVNGITTINFSYRIKKILFKEMEKTSTDDYDRVLSQGSWIIYDQYLTVQTWTKDFNPMQPYPLVVMTWIRLSGLPRYMYKKAILEAIDNMIGKVIKLNFQTDKKIRGRFARMAIYINLKRPLVSQPLVKG
ncbi:hypothetical protein GOBAR_DD29920 [Gossypium barbadense]|nr:hypothetical protein GOBAR_DD29920 [Gossypium barbadense]